MIENNSDAGHKSGKEPIYSKMAVLGFCLFFNPVFGGLLLRSNLNNIGERQAGLRALLFSVSLFMMSAMIGTTLFKSFAAIYISNLIGGALLVEYFYKKYFPDEEVLEKKSILKPLMLALMVSAILVLLLFLLKGK